MKNKIEKGILPVAAFLLLLQASFLTNAQKFTTSVSESFRIELDGAMFKSGNDFITFKETDKKTVFGITFKLSKAKFGIKLLLYDATMKLVKENHLSSGEKNFGPFPSAIKKINGKPWLVYFTYEDDEENSLKIMAAEIDPVSLNLGNAKELLQVGLGKSGLLKSLELLGKGQFLLKWSPDNTRLLSFWSSGLDNQVFMSVLDADLNPVWNKKEAISFSCCRG